MGKVHAGSSPASFLKVLDNNFPLLYNNHKIMGYMSDYGVFKNKKVYELIFKTARDIVPLFMNEVDQAIIDLPDDPVYRGHVARAILQMATLYILKGMAHPEHKYEIIINDYCTDLNYIINGQDDALPSE